MRIIAGSFRGRTLAVPKEIRPTQEAVRGAIFNMCQDIIQDAYVLDICAGSGALGLEALSRGAKHVYFVESARSSLQILKKNIELLSVDQSTTIFAQDVRVIMQLTKKIEPIKICFIDPPYAQHTDNSLMQDIVTSLDQNSAMFCEQAILFLESSKRCPPHIDHLRHFTCKNIRIYGETQLTILEKKAEGAPS